MEDITWDMIEAERAEMKNQHKQGGDIYETELNEWLDENFTIPSDAEVDDMQAWFFACHVEEERRLASVLLEHQTGVRAAG